MFSFDIINPSRIVHIPKVLNTILFKYDIVPIYDVREKGDKDATANMSASSIAETQMNFSYRSRRPATIQTKKEKFQ